MKKKVVVVSHCILNQDSVLSGWERTNGSYLFAKQLLHDGIYVLQLPCPEIIALGKNRNPMSYQEYKELDGFITLCEELLKPIYLQLNAFKEEGIHHISLIGIDESPNCAISKQRGVLMEIFYSMCNRLGLEISYLEVPTWYRDDNTQDFHERVDLFIKEKE